MPRKNLCSVQEFGKALNQGSFEYSIRALLNTAGITKLHSLQQKPEHNGVEGEVLEFDASAGRWKVHLHPDGLVLALKASNLAVLAPAESDSSNATLCDNCPSRCRSHSCALDARPPPTVPRTARCTQHTENGAL
jgi:hypothetical protein